jgi:serine/threonine protein kinase
MRVKQKLDDYELLDLIGRGAFGEVRLGRRKTTGRHLLIQEK